MLRPALRARLLQLFGLFDTDGNGSIDENELRALLMGLSVGKHKSGGIEEDLSCEHLSLSALCLALCSFLARC